LSRRSWRFTATSDFRKLSARDNKWRSLNCPEQVARVYLARIGQWQLPVLMAISTAPVLCPDGRIIDAEGYDPATGVFCDFQGVIFEPVPEEPTREEAVAAVEVFRDLFKTIKFVGETDFAVAMSAILTVLSRRCYPHAPIHCMDAHVAACGKTKTQDIASVIATGHEAEVCEFSPNGEELSKNLGALLMTGAPIICFDNIAKGVRLEGALLCQAATQTTLQVRVLQQSRVVLVRTGGTTIFANGNNLIIAGDANRRTVKGTIDPGVEAPETIVYDVEDPLITVKRERPRYIAAALTILRGYMRAGYPDPVPPLGSFEGWARLVPSALVWAGAGNPIDTMPGMRANDPERAPLLALLLTWVTAFPDARWVSVKQAIKSAEERVDMPGPDGYATPEFVRPDFRDALLAVAEDTKRRGEVSSVRLGKWLGANQGRVVDGKRFQGQDTRTATKEWRAV
jgi:putative DNA primase/helicase